MAQRGVSFLLTLCYVWVLKTVSGCSVLFVAAAILGIQSTQWGRKASNEERPQADQDEEGDGSNLPAIDYGCLRRAAPYVTHAKWTHTYMQLFSPAPTAIAPEMPRVPSCSNRDTGVSCQLVTTSRMWQSHHRGSPTFYQWTQSLAVKDEPHPQDVEALGLLVTLNPVRPNSSVKSTVLPRSNSMELSSSTTAAPSFAITTSSLDGGVCSNASVYLNPEHPPELTATRREVSEPCLALRAVRRRMAAGVMMRGPKSNGSKEGEAVLPALNGTCIPRKLWRLMRAAALSVNAMGVRKRIR